MTNDVNFQDGVVPMKDPNTQGSVTVNPLVHIVAPIASIAATMVARKVLNGTFKTVTGHTPPLPKDPSVSWGSAIAWTALTAATAAVVEVMVYRAALHWGEQTAVQNQPKN